MEGQSIKVVSRHECGEDGSRAEEGTLRLHLHHLREDLTSTGGGPPFPALPRGLWCGPLLIGPRVIIDIASSLNHASDISPAMLGRLNVRDSAAVASILRDRKSSTSLSLEDASIGVSGSPSAASPPLTDTPVSEADYQPRQEASEAYAAYASTSDR